MANPTRPRIVIVGHQGDQRARLASALADFGDVVQFGSPGTHGGQVDLVISDLPVGSLGARLQGAGERRTSPPAAWGLIGVGNIDGMDVCLPVDFTDRELRLACQSALRIAQLRVQCDELARLRQEVAQLAETDPLTGLPNRRAWESRLPTMLTRASQTGDVLWLALVDLDSFKAVNDREGMTAGDQVLTTTGRALAASVRRSDLVARLGGDEFGVLLANVAEPRIENVLDRLRRAVAASGEVTASLGYVAVRRGDDLGQLLAAAERAMRNAKRAGGDRIERGRLATSA